MTFCKECGDEIKDLAQNFCEKCGSPIPPSERSEETTPSPVVQAPTATSGMESYSRPGSLFDINRNYYILKEKYWDI